MFTFAIKKSFFDAWDNMGTTALSNLGLLAMILIAAMLPGVIFLIPFISVGCGVVSVIMMHVADGQRAEWQDVPAGLKLSWKGSLLFGLVIVIFLMITDMGMRFYSSIDSLAGALAGALMFWFAFGAYLTGMWFYAVMNRLTGGSFKSLKKCFMVMLDNLGLSLFAGFVLTPIQLLLWPLTAFGGFGPAGILLYYSNCLRLLLLKYEWLEAHPEAKRKDVPWDALLVEERDRLGTRTLKNLIWPWKD